MLQHVGGPSSQLAATHACATLPAPSHRCSTLGPPCCSGRDEHQVLVSGRPPPGSLLRRTQRACHAPGCSALPSGQQQLQQHQQQQHLHLGGKRGPFWACGRQQRTATHAFGGASASGSGGGEAAEASAVGGGQQVRAMQHSLASLAFALYKFTRPHTMAGTFISVVSISLLALQSQGPGVVVPASAAATGLAQALASALLMNVAIVGINQLFDIDIDKVGGGAGKAGRGRGWPRGSGPPPRAARHAPPPHAPHEPRAAPPLHRVHHRHTHRSTSRTCPWPLASCPCTRPRTL